jgi:glutathione S-transferase
MVTLYELSWSHYCEKVRLALDYMGLPWQAVSIDAFAKAPLRTHPRPAHMPSVTVPAISDSLTGAYVMDSTPILRYLANSYPDAPRLFPADPAGRAAVDAMLIELDSQLGILARRFGYTQLILECPAFLTELFLAHRVHGLYCAPGVRWVAGATMGMILTQRFEFHRSEERGMYEALERYLLGLAASLGQRPFVVGDELSAADLALAALLRPLLIVPFFAEHEGLRELFERRRRVLTGGAGQADFPYQTAIHEARRSRAPVRRKLRERSTVVPFEPSAGMAANDQRRLWTWEMMAIPLHYAYTLRRNKVRQREASAQIR